MSLADDLKAPPLARKVAEIIKDHAARLELGPDWADAAALRVLVEVGRADADPEACPAGCTGLSHRVQCPEWVLPL